MAVKLPRTRQTPYLRPTHGSDAHGSDARGADPYNSADTEGEDFGTLLHWSKADLPFLVLMTGGYWVWLVLAGVLSPLLYLAGLATRRGGRSYGDAQERGASL